MNGGTVGVGTRSLVISSISSETPPAPGLREPLRVRELRESEPRGSETVPSSLDCLECARGIRALVALSPSVEEARSLGINNQRDWKVRGSGFSELAIETTTKSYGRLRIG